MPEMPAAYPSRAFHRVHRGARALADACRPTLGPGAHPVLVRRRNGHPLISDDGATLRGEMELDDPVEKLGAQVLNEAADRTADAVGDGTTTANLLAYTLFSRGLEHLRAGSDPAELGEGISRGIRRASEVLEGLSRPLGERAETARIATLAAGGDPRVGELVAEAFQRVGADGTVSVEDGPGEPGVETMGGIRFDGGFLSPYFVTESEGRTAVHSRPRLLLCDGIVSSMTPLLPVMERVAREGRPLVVVARGIADDVVATLVVHELRGTLACLAVRAPEPDEGRAGALEDLAVLSGARVLEGDITPECRAPTLEDLGAAERVTATSHRTEVLGGGGDPSAIEVRCKELCREAALAPSHSERKRLQDRLTNLSGGMAVLRPGSRRPNGRSPRRDVLERAIGSTRAALQKGVIPGGGAAFLRAIPILEEEADRARGAQEAGIRLVLQALEVPARQIAENAGVDGDAVVRRMAGDPAGWIFDAVRREYVAPLEGGIVDPVKVACTALENAGTVAGMLLTAVATLADGPRTESPAVRDGETARPVSPAERASEAAS